MKNFTSEGNSVENERNNELIHYFDEIINQARNGITISDPNQEDNPVVYINKAFTDIFGYSKEETIGRNCRFLQGEDTDQKNLVKIREAIKQQEGITTVLRNYTKEGKLIYNEIKISPIFDKKTGKLKYYLGIQRDISDLMDAQSSDADSIYEKIIHQFDQNSQKLSKDEFQIMLQELHVYQTELIAQNNELLEKDNRLENTNRELQSLFHDAPLPYLLIDKNLVIKKYNKIADEYFEFSKLTMPTKSLFMVIPKEVMHKLVTWINNKYYEKNELEIDMICKDGKLKRFKLNGKKYILNPDILMVSMTDIQEQHEINNNLEKIVEEKTSEVLKQHELISKQSKLASMGEMIDAVAHQWLNPISVIKLHGQMCKYSLENQTPNLQEAFESLDKIEFQIEHLVETLSEFRAFFRPDQNYEKVSICSTIDSVLLLVKDDLISNQIEVTVDIQDDKEIRVIKNQFKHVLLNLITNSRDAFVENSISNRKIVFSCLTHDDCIEIQFADNAGGIPEGIIERIFELNFTTKGEGRGTGVGLYLTKQILEKMDSNISVENKEDGALFCIEINRIFIA